MGVRIPGGPEPVRQHRPGTWDQSCEEDQPVRPILPLPLLLLAALFGLAVGTFGSAAFISAPLCP
jgi:hypothetical protein